MSRSNTRAYYRPTLRSARACSSEQGFVCVQCQLYVTCAPNSSGVQNRNHCPGCLWSRHLDWHVAGDRMSLCQAAMQPVGLTTKHGRNKYTQERDGELMLIHRCTACETLVINRIAADDCIVTIFEVFTQSCEGSASLQTKLDQHQIAMLGTCDGDLLRRRLLGNQSSYLYERASLQTMER